MNTFAIEHGVLRRIARRIIETMISYSHNNARPWNEIIAFYASIPHSRPAIEMERLARELQDAGYVDAGLHGLTSMMELLLGPARDVLNNPHLRVSPEADHARLSYEDGSVPAWFIDVEYEELLERVERVILKRVRWFRKPTPAVNDDTTS
ncbi:MAG: hypothetical protein QM811_19400 [Pirellulales bacterium]